MTFNSAADCDKALSLLKGAFQAGNLPDELGKLELRAAPDRVYELRRRGSILAALYTATTAVAATNAFKMVEKSAAGVVRLRNDLLGGTLSVGVNGPFGLEWQTLLKDIEGAPKPQFTVDQQGLARAGYQEGAVAFKRVLEAAVATKGRNPAPTS